MVGDSNMGGPRFPREMAMPVLLAIAFFMVYRSASSALKLVALRAAGVTCFLAVYRMAAQRMKGLLEPPGGLCAKGPVLPWRHPEAAGRSRQGSKPLGNYVFERTCREITASLISQSYFVQVLERRGAPEEVLSIARNLEHGRRGRITVDQVAGVIERLEECE